jgi:hypothetical protein
MPLPRFRIRTLMIAVAAVAVDFAILAQIDPQTEKYHYDDQIWNWKAMQVLFAALAMACIGIARLERLRK